MGDVGVGGGLVEAGGAAAVTADGQAAEPDVDAVGVDLGAGVTDGGDETAPVGIGAGPGGFDERRMGDGFGDAKSIGIRCRSFDVQFDDVSDAFAVGDDLSGERGADLGEGGGELGVIGADGCAAGSGGEQQDGVVGGGVAVNGDAVEADFDGLAEVGVEDGGLDGGVGEDVDEHGGVGYELRVNHAGAFGQGGDADFFTRAGRAGDGRTGDGRVRDGWVWNFKAGEGGFLGGVGGEDGLGDLLEVVEVGAEGGGEGGKDGDELFSREGDADDAGGRWENFFGEAVEELSGGGAGGAGGGEAGFTGGAVGVAGVDGGYADAAAGGAEMFLVDDQGRGGDAVSGEDGSGAGGDVGHDEGEVGAATLFEAGFGSGKTEAAGKEELGGVRHDG